MYSNCWVVAWATDRAPGERTQSHLQAQVKAIRLSDWKGVEPGHGVPCEGSWGCPLQAPADSGCFWNVPEGSNDHKRGLASQ